MVVVEVLKRRPPTDVLHLLRERAHDTPESPRCGTSDT
jgi:hypothetical protein